MLPAPRLMRAMVLGLAVAALPTLFGEALWVAPAAMWVVLAGLSLVDAWALARAHTEVVAALPRRVGVGADVRGELRLSRRGRLWLRATLRAETREPLTAADDVTLRLPGGTSAVALPLNAPRRGLGRLDAVWLRLDGPFRLLRKIERHEQKLEAEVVPNTERVRETLLAHFGAQRFGGVHVERRIGDGGDFDSLEGYEPGMDLRSVDWKTSARHQQLRVRRYRVEQNQRVIVCVDTGRLMAEPIDGLMRLDHAIHASLMLAQVALRSGDRVGAHAYDERPQTWVPPNGGLRQMARLEHGLAALRATPSETNHVLGVRQLLTRLRRRSLVVVFSEFADATTAELMIEHVGHLARRHLVVFVALDDPGLGSYLDVAPSRPEDLAAGVVSTQLVADRLRVLRRLSRMGVDVVHAPPGRAALALVERYVRAKRRSLIG